MQLSQSLHTYTEEQLSAREAQRLAEFIAWGPAVFQTARLMLKWGVLDLLRDSAEGLTRAQICQHTQLSDYAVRCLTEASLSIGIILVDPQTERFTISKTGWFLINDPAVRVNIDFNQDVNYEGWFRLGESLKSGRPEGLRHFGDWPTVYEALSQLPEQVRQSWFGFDHFYSDSAFPAALDIVFGQLHTRRLYDVGGNTGKWALRCVDFDPEVEVTVIDLPQQIEMMRRNIAGKRGAERIGGLALDLLDERARFPKMEPAPDVIWMSQFLDCFSKPQIVGILRRASEAMGADTRICIMETLWNRQRFEPAAFCLTMTSLYFAAIANGNSKMYSSEDMVECIHEARLEVEQVYDHLGQGHSILVCKKASPSSPSTPSIPSTP